MRKYVSSMILLTSLFSTGISYAIETVATEVEQATFRPTITADGTTIFTIINESPFTVPVSLELSIIDRNKNLNAFFVHDRKDFEPRTKMVEGNTTITFTKSDCCLWTWIMDSLKIQQPANCDFYARLSFNIGYYREQSISQQVELILNLKDLMPGSTYRIVPSHYLIPSDKPFNSFQVNSLSKDSTVNGTWATTI